MRKRPRIQDSLQPPPVPAEPAPEPAASAPAARSAKDPRSNAGKVNISAWFPPDVKSSIRLVQAKRGGRMQDLIGEALNLLFAKYQVPETAPVERD